MNKGLAPAAATNVAAKGLNAHQWRLVEGFFAGITESVLHHLGQPAAEGGNGSDGMGHGMEEKASA